MKVFIVLSIGTLVCFLLLVCYNFLVFLLNLMLSGLINYSKFAAGTEKQLYKRMEALVQRVKDHHGDPNTFTRALRKSYMERDLLVRKHLFFMKFIVSFSDSC